MGVAPAVVLHAKKSKAVIIRPFYPPKTGNYSLSGPSILEDVEAAHLTAGVAKKTGSYSLAGRFNLQKLEAAYWTAG
jgi:hypothetical protein